MIRKIKDLKVGDYVLSVNKEGKAEYKKLADVRKEDNRETYKYITEDGHVMIETPNHRVLQYSETEGLYYEKIGKAKYVLIVTDTGVYKRKIIYSEFYEISTVVDIEVEENHSILTNGYIWQSNSRAGAQVPFSSLNFGTDTTPEGRLVSKNLMLAIEAGLGHGETSIFPICIFKVKEGINYNPGDSNYDLFKLACKVSSKRLFPNFSFIDAPFNLQYYKPGNYDTEIAYMGCRTRVIGNVYDPKREIVTSRGNLSFTTINLPRLAILSKLNTNSEKDRIELFYKLLDEKMELVIDQLLDRLRIQSKKKVKNYPFLMGQKVWIDSEKLDTEDSVGEILKHGSLSMGFIGLAEALVVLVGKHHGESKKAQDLGINIITKMRNRMDKEADKTKLNFGLLASPAEGLSGRFTRLDKKRFGVIEGVTDRAYYTNSFHVPVYFNITAYKKIKLEAPYHALTNAGHISYIEMDGDPSRNIKAFEKVVRAMKEAGIGYGTINHPVDMDPVCGYTGIINDICPNCGRSEKDGVPFSRIRRITGYLVGETSRFNSAKKAEERDRVKHGISTEETTEERKEN